MNNFHSRIISKIEIEQQALKEHENKSQKIWNEINKKQNNVLNKLDVLEQNVSNTTANITQILVKYEDLMNQQFNSLIEAKKTVYAQEANIKQLNSQLSEMNAINSQSQETREIQRKENQELESLINKHQKIINKIEANHLKQNRAWEDKMSLIQAGNGHIVEQMKLSRTFIGLSLILIVLLLLIIVWR